MAEIKMPQLGESVVEGTISRWLKKPGDTIQKYETLCEVITDKVNAEIPSDFSGTIQEIRVTEGMTVSVGTVICVIETAEEAALNHATQAPVSSAQAPEFKTSENQLQAPRFSPAVMQLITQFGIDPSQITGTGTGGRITRKDVLVYVEARSKFSSVVPVVEEIKPEPATEAAPMSSDRNETPRQETPGPAMPTQGDTFIAVSPVRRTIAKRMLESKHQAPHAWMMVEVDVSPLAKYRESVKDEFQRKEGVSLTYLPFFIKAIVESIKEFPLLNSVWAEDRIILKNEINISIAVAAGDALYVPVIHKADRQSIAGLAHSIFELAFKARNGKLAPHEVQGGTFTVNNTGAFGSIQSMPIINSPQAAILSVESIVRRPVVIRDDAIAIRSMVNLCLSLDHRILDGLVCGRFMQSLKNRLEAMGTQDIQLF